MRRFFLVAAALCLLAGSAQAQEYHRVEIFGGYSYLNSDQFPDRESLNTPGYHIGLAGNLSKHFGVAAEVSGHYGKVTFRGIGLDPEFDADTTTFLFGPRVRTNGHGTNAFAHVLVGGARTKVETFDSETKFALAVGGGLDFIVSKRVAVRAIQFDYLPIRTQLTPTGFRDDTAHNFRASIGFVFRFGG